MYLDEEVISLKHPMHEYIHLWNMVIRDARLWTMGKKLVQTEAADLWKEITESENYGKKWEALAYLDENDIEDLIASEVHARLIGDASDKYVKKHHYEIKDMFNEYRVRSYYLYLPKKIGLI